MKRIPDELGARLISALASGQVDENFSIVQLAKVSGIPRATLYYYFSGKEDLVGFVAESITERIRVATTQAALAPGTAAARLEATLLAGVGITGEHPILDVALLRAMNESGSLVTRIFEMRDIGFGAVREILTEARDLGELDIDDVEATATSIFGATLMVALSGLLTAGEINEEHIRGVARVHARGLAPQRTKRSVGVKT